MVVQKWDKEADVVVVGLGGAGAAAAIEAHDAGAKVLVLEKMDKPGGTTLVSAGIVVGANSQYQREQGVEDSAEECFKFYKAIAEGFAEEEKLRLMAEKGGETVDWLMKEGVKFSFVYIGGPEEYPEYAAITPPKARGHQVPEFTGEGFIRPLVEAINKRGIEVLYNTAAKELIAEPATREVKGVRTETGLNIKAKRAVALTAGGYSRNEDMFRDYLYSYYKVIWPCTAPGCTGDAIKMGQALGADLKNMGLMTCIVDGILTGPPSYTEPVVIELPVVRLVYRGNCLCVDKKGKRFADDFLFYDRLGPSILNLEGKFYWLIWDEETMKLGGTTLITPTLSPDLSKEMELGVIKKAPNIRELAVKMDIAPDVLEDTIYTYNENAKKGVDPEFGRTKFLDPLDHPPYYVAKVSMSFADTCGGLKTDTDSRVLDVIAKPIPRLYAAGSTTGGYIGKWYTSGTFICNAFVSGRIAGQNAAKETPWE